MLRSMTGFASKTITLSSHDAKTNVVITLKSLNARFFETTCKLHYQCNNLELDLIKLMKENLHRGHVYLTIYITNQDFFKGNVEPSLATIEGYLQAIKKIKDQYAIEGTLSISTVLQLPNVFSIEEKNIDDASKKAIFDGVQELIHTLIQMQQKEGAALTKDLEQRIAIMESVIAAIEKASAALIDLQKAKINKTLQELTAEQSVDMQKHAAYLLLDKMDINEEIVRFKSHLKNLQATITSADIEKGKRLDFILQEMAREINTIAAKCSDATIGSLAINIKVELEKAREQTQNIV